MKIIELVLRHPVFFENMLAKSSGPIGELLIAEELVKIGYKVQHKNNNSKQSDLIAISPKGISFSIEVKCGNQKRPTWFVRTCPDPNLSDFWFFISAPRKADELPDLDECNIFILTSKEAKEIWELSPWNIKNPNNGDVRRHQLPDDAINAWHKLPT